MPTRPRQLASHRRFACSVIGIVALALAWPLSATGQAADVTSQCQLRVESWAREAGRRLLVDVSGVCGDAVVEAERATVNDAILRFEGDVRAVIDDRVAVEADELSVDQDGALSARGICLARLDGSGPRCCAEQVERHTEGRWLLEQATCELPDGADLRATSAVWGPSGVELTSARSGEPIVYPLATARLDSVGRAPGLRAPTLGYRSDRGAGGRADVFVPVGATGGLGLGLFGETKGGLGADVQLGWSGPSGRPRHLGGFVAWDGVTERHARASLRADMALRTGDGLGLAASGRLDTDGAVGRDYGTSTLDRERRDRHLGVAAWTGGGSDRLWVGVYQRQVSPAPADTTSTPVPDHLGVLPAAGWLATLDIDRIAGLGASLRFDRADSRNAGDVLNGLRLVAGGELRALSWPALTVLPGVWLELDSVFSDPDLDNQIQSFGTAVHTSLLVSSPWIGGSSSRRHLLEPYTQLLWRAVDVTEGGRELEGRELGPPLRLETGLRQTLTAGLWRLHAPVYWTGAIDDGLEASRLTLGLVLRRPGTVEWRLDQQLEVDVDGGGMAAWMGATSLLIGADTPGSTARADRPSLGGATLALGLAMLVVESELATASALDVPRNILVARRPPGLTGARENGWRGGLTWLSVDLGSAGTTITSAWPASFSERPDLTGVVWLGRSDQLRLLASGGVLADDTALALLTLVLGAQTPMGPWTPSLGW